MKVKLSQWLLCMSFVLLFFSAMSLNAAEMRSGNYFIERSSINIGGMYEKSENYIFDATVGEDASGFSRSETYSLKAGYQQTDGVTLSISDSSDIVLGPAIPSQGGGTSNGSTFWTVTTNNTAGYILTIRAHTSPGLKSSSSSFSDYTPTIPGTPDFIWQVTNTESEFGFTPEGNDTTAKFLDDGLDSCGVGAINTIDTCWWCSIRYEGGVGPKSRE